MSTVLITGANRGIGLEFARQYAEAGWRVLATCRDPENAASLQDLALKAPSLSIFALDVTNAAQIKELAVQLRDEAIDLLINNAGILTSKDTLGSFSADNFHKIYQTNAVAPLLISEAFCPHVAKSGLKVMVAISSKVASIGQDKTAGLTAYRMSKAALNMGMQEIARRLEPQQIRVLLIAPGHVKTDMGGASALLTVEESVAKMRRVIDRAASLKSGGFYDRNGDEIGW